jgi:hypothetical protein
MPIRSGWLIPFLAILGACGGGDDDANTGAPASPAQEVAFTSFNSVLPGQIVTASGQAQTQNVIQNVSGTVTAQSLNSPDLNAVSATWTYGTAPPLVPTGIRFVIPRIGVTWNDGQPGQTVVCDTRSCSASGSASDGVLVNALGNIAWNFQTFGYWLSVTGLPANIAGSISAGSQSAISGIPVSGTATYNGISGGLYVGPAGALQEHKAILSANVNFDPIAQTIDFSTMVTTIRPWTSTGIPSPATTLNISGQLTYASGTNRFSGSVIMGPTISPTMTGEVTGVFYGPNAEEIGGTFFLSSPLSPQLESITGSFGGKR